MLSLKGENARASLGMTHGTYGLSEPVARGPGAVPRVWSEAKSAEKSCGSRSVLPIPAAGVFANTDEWFLQLLSNHSKQRVLMPGHVIVSDGERTDSLFILVHGEVEVSMHRTKVCVFHGPNFFGESIALGLRDQSTVTFQARTVCDVRAFPGRLLRTLLQGFPEEHNRFTEEAKLRIETLDVWEKAPGQVGRKYITDSLPEGLFEGGTNPVDQTKCSSWSDAQGGTNPIDETKCSSWNDAQGNAEIAAQSTEDSVPMPTRVSRQVSQESRCSTSEIAGSMTPRREPASPTSPLMSNTSRRSLQISNLGQALLRTSGRDDARRALHRGPVVAAPSGEHHMNAVVEEEVASAEPVSPVQLRALLAQPISRACSSSGPVNVYQDEASTNAVALGDSNPFDSSSDSDCCLAAGSACNAISTLKNRRRARQGITPDGIKTRNRSLSPPSPVKETSPNAWGEDMEDSGSEVLAMTSPARARRRRQMSSDLSIASVDSESTMFSVVATEEVPAISLDSINGSGHTAWPVPVPPAGPNTSTGGGVSGSHGRGRHIVQRSIGGGDAEATEGLTRVNTGTSEDSLDWLQRTVTISKDESSRESSVSPLEDYNRRGYSGSGRCTPTLMSQHGGSSSLTTSSTLGGMSPLRTRGMHRTPRSGRSTPQGAGQRPGTGPAPRRQEGWETSLCEDAVICYPGKLPSKDTFAKRKQPRAVSPDRGNGDNEGGQLQSFVDKQVGALQEASAQCAQGQWMSQHAKGMGLRVNTSRIWDCSPPRTRISTL